MLVILVLMHVTDSLYSFMIAERKNADLMCRITSEKILNKITVRFFFTY